MASDAMNLNASELTRHLSLVVRVRGLALHGARLLVVRLLLAAVRVVSPITVEVKGID